jgi:hypothetical protein
MAEYQLTGDPNYVRKPAEMMLVPNHPHNTDWIAYQAWLDDGGVPDPVKPFVSASLDSVGVGNTIATILGV